MGPELPWPVLTASTKPHRNDAAQPPMPATEAKTAAATDGSAAAGAASKPAAPATPPKQAEAPPAPEKTAAAKPAPVPTPKPKPKPKPVVHRSRQEICATLAKAADNNNLPVPFFIRLLFQESRFQAGAVSHAGAQGIAQFMPGTATDVGLDNPFDPLQAIPAAARLLRGLIDQFGNLGLAAAAYNAGPGRVNKWLKQQGELPAETRGYVKTITGQPPESWKVATAAHANAAVPQQAPCQTVPAHTRVAAQTVPLPEKRPAAARAPVRTAHPARKPPAKPATAVAAAKAHAGHHAHTAIQLAARRRGKKQQD